MRKKKVAEDEKRDKMHKLARRLATPEHGAGGGVGDTSVDEAAHYSVQVVSKDIFLVILEGREGNSL